jgi:hypothetical protein
LIQEQEQLKKLIHSLINSKNIPQIHNDHVKSEVKVNKRVAGLEAFRQCIETFYLVDNLLIKKKKQF